MGLGVSYWADVPRRGWRRQPVPPDDLWRTVDETAARLVARDGNPLAHLYSSHSAGDRLWLNLVPFEEYVEFALQDGRVQCSAKSSSAGPGYHQLVVELLDDVERSAGLEWTVGDDSGDETGYRDERDVSRLRQVMAEHLRGMASLIVRDGLTGIRFSGDLHARPLTSAYALSSVGDWSEAWMREVAAAEGERLLDLARSFYPWWTADVGAEELQQFGRALCWSDVRWVPPRTESEERVMRVALACLDGAAASSGAIAMESERVELRRLLEHESQDETADAPPAAEGIGCRRGLYEMAIGGGWTMRIPGYFHQEFEDDGATQVYWFSDRVVRASTLSADDATARDMLGSMELEGREPLEGLSPGLLGIVKSAWDPSDRIHVTHVSLAVPGALCAMTFTHGDEAGRQWALDVARTVRHAPPRAE